MDPITILGAAASATTVVQLCTESLGSLLRLQNKFRNADLTVRSLITQLSTLRTALSQISEWVENSVQSALPHILPDLTISLGGCRVLIETLNDRLSRLEYDQGKPLSMRKRAQSIWDEKERTDYLTLLSHNIAALQLLLTAMQCRSQSEQNALLRISTNREIITKARDDTSSLLWFRDDDSHGTRKSTCTENSELLDLSFVFDSEIFSSRPYLTAMKSNMKRTVREAHIKAQAQHSSSDDFNRANQSVEDARTITGDVERIPGKTVGLHPSAGEESTVSDAQPYVGTISDSPTRSIGESAPDSWSLSALETTSSIPSRPGSAIVEKGGYSAKRPDHGSRRLSRMPGLLKSQTSISSQTSLDAKIKLPQLVTDNEEKLLLIGNAKSSGSIILKSMVLEYGEPSETTAGENAGIQEILIPRKSAGMRYNYRIYDVVGMHSKENRWIYSFDEMSTLIFVVDLSTYDLPASDDCPLSCIQEDLALFRQICSSKWLTMTPILLILSHTDILGSKLQVCPLASYFPDYTGKPTNLEAAKSFFSQRFLSLNLKYAMRIRVVFADSVATVKLGKVVVDNVDKILTEGKVLAFGAR